MSLDFSSNLYEFLFTELWAPFHLMSREEWLQSSQSRASHSFIKHAAYLPEKGNGKAVSLTKQALRYVIRKVLKYPMRYAQGKYPRICTSLKNSMTLLLVPN